MANAVPQWLLTKNVALAVSPITVDTAGVLTTGTAAVNFFGVLSAGNPFGVQNEVTKVDFSNSDNPYNNKVITQQGSSMTITEVLQASASTAIGATDSNTGLVKNAIEKLALTAQYFHVVAIWKDSGGTTRHTNTGDWQYNGHGEVYTKTGQCTMAMGLETFTIVNAGAYTGSVTIS